MDCIDLAQDRDQLMALVNTVMNVRIPQNSGNFLEVAQLMASREGLNSKVLVTNDREDSL
jgi:hypothetical protein